MESGVSSGGPLHLVIMHEQTLARDRAPVDAGAAVALLDARTSREPVLRKMVGESEPPIFSLREVSSNASLLPAEVAVPHRVRAPPACGVDGAADEEHVLVFERAPLRPGMLAPRVQVLAHVLDDGRPGADVKIVRDARGF